MLYAAAAWRWLTLPPLAWVAIAIIVIVFVVINIALVALLRAKTPPHLSPRYSRRPPGTTQDLAKITQAMRDPFARERGQLDELSRLVDGLNETHDTGGDSKSKPE